MISRNRKTIKQIKIEFDKNFINNLSILSKKRIEPITKYIGNKEIIIGFNCPVIMNEDTFEQDKKIIEANILKSFADSLNSEICNRKKEHKQRIRGEKRKIKYVPIPCPICGSTDTIGDGNRKTKLGLKPKRYCRHCKKYYTNQDGAIWKMKKPKHVIEEALELSKKMSLRDAASRIKEKYDIDISYSAILYWRKNKFNSFGHSGMSEEKVE